MSVPSYMIGFIKGSINNTIESGIDVHSFLNFLFIGMIPMEMGEVLCHRIKVFGCLILLLNFFLERMYQCRCPNIKVNILVAQGHQTMYMKGIMCTSLSTEQMKTSENFICELSCFHCFFLIIILVLVLIYYQYF